MPIVYKCYRCGKTGEEAHYTNELTPGKTYDANTMFRARSITRSGSRVMVHESDVLCGECLLREVDAIQMAEEEDVAALERKLEILKKRRARKSIPESKNRPKKKRSK